MHYTSRPWSTCYEPGQPLDVGVEAASVLQVAIEQAQADPGAPCLHYFEQSFSRRDVIAYSAAFAAGLRRAGVAAGDRVGLYLQNVPEFVMALLGIWQAGAIGVLINPMYKDRELGLIVRDSGCSAVVCMESLAVTARALGEEMPVRRIVTVPDAIEVPRPGAVEPNTQDRPAGFWTLVAQNEGGLADVRPAPSDLGCLTYTSGTTGPPKGALNTHEKLLFSSRTFQRWMSLDETDVVLGIAPLFHITGLVAHLTAALVSGAPLVLFHRFSPERAVEQTRRHKATYTVAAITAFQAIIELTAVPAEDLRTLRKIYSGGGPVPPSVIEEFESCFGTYIHPIYGLTESTSPAIITPAGARAPVDPLTGALSIGVPVYNTVVRIIDDRGDDSPIGHVGELLIRGPQVVDGYWNKPDESAAAVGGEWLRTGDIGYMDAEGWFYLIDRKKDQINVSGYKVWPREVEDVLYEHPGVREAAVVGVPDPYRGETVKAYVSLRPGHEVGADSLVEFCRQRLAAYKYPRRIELVGDLPKTASGKILRRSLRQRD